MAFHRPLGQHESGGDLAVGHRLGDEFSDLAFAPCQRIGGRRIQPAHQLVGSAQRPGQADGAGLRGSLSGQKAGARRIRIGQQFG